MSGPPKLVLLTPFGRAFALLPEHVLRTLLLESIAPIQSDGELLISLCYERVPREHATGEEFNHLYQLDDLTQGWTRQLVKYTPYFDELVDKILRRLPGPPEAADRTEAVQSLVHLLQMVPAGKSSWKYTANEVDYSIQDRANCGWHGAQNQWSCPPQWQNGDTGNHPTSRMNNPSHNDGSNKNFVTNGPKN